MIKKYKTNKSPDEIQNILRNLILESKKNDNDLFDGSIYDITAVISNFRQGGMDFNFSIFFKKIEDFTFVEIRSKRKIFPRFIFKAWRIIIPLFFIYFIFNLLTNTFDSKLILFFTIFLFISSLTFTTLTIIYRKFELEKFKMFQDILALKR